MSDQPARCRESWRLSEELRNRAARLAASGSMQDQEDKDHVVTEMQFHHRTCPTCIRYFRSLAQEVPHAEMAESRLPNP